MRKERHNPDKAQNNYGGDYSCDQWSKIDEGKLRCNGNRHNCMK